MLHVIALVCYPYAIVVASLHGSSTSMLQAGCVQALSGLNADALLACDFCCSNQWTCPQYCGLCARNPNKRCETDGDWAPKHVEQAKLETCCHATLQATLSCPEFFQGDQPDAAAPFEAQQFYVEVSLKQKLLLQNVLSYPTFAYDLQAKLAGCMCLYEFEHAMSVSIVASLYHVSLSMQYAHFINSLFH